jgi:hypothetical protein
MTSLLKSASILPTLNATEPAHQRLYDNQVALSTVGINIRGRRSSRLTLSYRTTREILKVATQLLTGKPTTTWTAGPTTSTAIARCCTAHHRSSKAPRPGHRNAT